MQFLIGSLFGTKCDLLDLLLGKGKVMVHLDARRDGVEVPNRFKSDHHLRLKLSLWFGIDDFVYDDEGVRASLSFGGTRFYCVLPWHAIFAMTSHVEPIGYLWPEDLPSELASQLTPTSTSGLTEPRPHARKRGLRVVEGGRGGVPSGGESHKAATGDESLVEPAAMVDSTPPTTMVDSTPPTTEETGTDSDVDVDGDDDPGRKYGHLRVVK